MGLAENEYLRSVSLTFDHFNPRDRISETSYILRTFGFLGDVIAEDEQHRPLTDGQRVHVDTYFSADEFAQKKYQTLITYTNSSLNPWNFLNFSNGQGKRYDKAISLLQGDEFAMRAQVMPYIHGNSRPISYFYTNGHQHKGFYFILKLPKGFSLKQDSIKIDGIPNTFIGPVQRLSPQQATDLTIWAVPIIAPYTFKRGQSYFGNKLTSL